MKSKRCQGTTEAPWKEGLQGSDLSIPSKYLGRIYDFNVCPTKETEGKYMNRRNKIKVYSCVMILDRFYKIIC